MIEIRNACKTYTAKSGIATTAINDVSFKLPNTGMVFLVGKSGAGKSTLLNVLGGLDYLDSGEIIINGKSTKDFSKREYDSYRNTYVGFVFQEFHIIDSLSIGENIALAIKLQNKKPNKDIVRFILDEVGLDGYMDRMPNELSGGQLQRVAIARALVKKPQIIIADEPTGSLDSSTGNQIFETLKMLSHTHLVLVVSHDLDFAKQFADRIIEIKDGKIINDVERDNDKTSPESQFVKTDESKITGTTEPLALIKSKMPIKEASLMGASALLHKKLKLVASIFLSVVSFTMLGLSSIIGYYNDADVCARTFTNFPVINFAHYNKTVVSSDPNLGTEDGTLGEEDKQILEKAVGVPFTVLTEMRFSLKNNLPLEVRDDIDIRFASQFSNATYIPKDKLSSFNIDIIVGNAPENDKEIAISKYVYETFEKYKYRNEGTDYEIKSPSDMIGKRIFNTGSDVYTITAVYDTHFDNHNHYFDKLWSRHDEIAIENTKGFEEYKDYVNSLAGAMFMNKEVEHKRSESQSIVGTFKNKNINTVKKMYNFAFAKHKATTKDQEEYPEYEYARYSLKDNVTSGVLGVIQRASLLRKLFLSFGIVFVIFSGLLLGNFIANSISYQRKEIGILRAIGARGIDVFKIYIAESLIISLINFALSVVSSFLVFKFIFEPNILESISGVSLYSFTYIQPLLILVVSIVSAFIATFIPVALSTRQKPIDAIRLK